MVAYLLPVVGIALGTLLGEPVTAGRIAGTALILAGIALVNSGPTLRRLADSRAAAGRAASA
jgi:drug/metabolite transporter (DMT)-like permease